MSRKIRFSNGSPSLTEKLEVVMWIFGLISVVSLITAGRLIWKYGENKSGNPALALGAVAFTIIAISSIHTIGG